MVLGTVLALLELVIEHTKSLHMLGMLSGSLEERNRVVTLVGLEILGKLGVLPVDKELEVPK